LKGLTSGEVLLVELSCGRRQKRKRTQVRNQEIQLTASNFFYFLAVLGFELKASHLLGRQCTTWATPPAPSSYLILFHFMAESHCIAQAGLKLMILLPPKCRDYRHVPPIIHKGGVFKI
jgi:hypothetical protein